MPRPLGHQGKRDPPMFVLSQQGGTSRIRRVVAALCTVVMIAGTVFYIR